MTAITDERMALKALVEKTSDADLLNKMIGFAANRLMALEADTLCNAGRHERTADRLNTRNGTVIGDPRRYGRAADSEAQERLLLSGIFGASADRRKGSDRGDPGGLRR
jgi:hypothetical protein